MMGLIDKFVKFQKLRKLSDGEGVSYEVDGKKVAKEDYEKELKRIHILRGNRTESNNFRDMNDGGMYTLRKQEITQYIFPFLQSR